MRILKRSVAVLLVLALATSLFAVSAFAANGYSITVNGVEFKSGENKSGDGWSYTASSRALTLNGYSGGAIVSDGDISVNITGDVSLKAETSSTYSALSCGIYVNGALTLTVTSGASASISGADSDNIRGGDGITASEVVLNAPDAALISISGGNSVSAKGGFGLKTNKFTMNANNTFIEGGNGVSGLYYTTSFTVDSDSQATIISGADGVSAVTYLTGADYHFADDITSTFEENNSIVYISSMIGLVYGDLTGDGSVDVGDAILLAKYLAGWSFELDERTVSAADVYYTGSVNAADAVLLSQYIAEWSGVHLGK